MPTTEHRTAKGTEPSRMPKAGWKEIALLLVCVSIPCWIICASRRSAGGQIQTIDFGEIYYGARCALHRSDPYNPNLMLREFQKDGGHFAPEASDQGVDRIVVTGTVNLPTALLLTIPFALLPWWLAQNVWMILTAGLLVVAAFLTWDLGAGAAPLLWAALAGFMLAESDLLFKVGNVAGIAISLCVIAVWCFIKPRYVWAGVALLALSLVLKPHDTGLIWLYFLLAGGVLRKRALQTLAIACVLALLAALWIEPLSPHWPRELRSNLAVASVRGGTSDPGPSGIGAHSAGVIIDLQGALSGFKDDAAFYNPLAYLIGGIPILIFAFATLRKRQSPQGTRLALAAISILTLLPLYHRINDAVLLLLALPACAQLWRERGPKRWLAVGLTAAGILATASTPLAFLAVNSERIAAIATKLPGKLPSIFALRPTPFVLLAMGCFYLWVYLRSRPDSAAPDLA